MRIEVLLLALLSLVACTKPRSYRAELIIDQDRSIPFMMERLPGSFTVINASDRIGPEALSIVHLEDSTVLRHHAFQSELRFVERNDSLLGYWVDLSRDRTYRMPFRAYLAKERFETSAAPEDVSGRWDVTFNADTRRNKAIGEFKQTDEVVHGTFLTPTGDYRFMDGVMDGDRLLVSTFDFAHAYYVEAQLTEDSLHGTFYSGYHYNAPWLGHRNAGIELVNLDTVAPWDNNKADSFHFTDLEGASVELDHPWFENKAIVIQLFGSWCPNCYDESRLLQTFYQEYRDSGLAIVGVGFERPSNPKTAIGHIQRFKSGLGLSYPMGYGGVSSKDTAQKRFPALQTVWSFPTLLFYNKDHQLVAVHSGFNGPGTGVHYDREVAELRQKIQDLIREP